MTSRRANHPILAASCGATCPSWNSMGLEVRDADAMIHSNTGELGAKLAACQNNGTLKGDHLCCLTNLGMRPSRGTDPILRPKLSTISAARISRWIVWETRSLHCNCRRRLPCAVPLVVNKLSAHALGVRILQCHVKFSMNRLFRDCHCGWTKLAEIFGHCG